MRVVSLVPSWTETLLEAQVEVVGRTRYCVHPKLSTALIPVVGGTKDINWEEVKKLQPDLVVMDVEENPREFSEACPFPWYASQMHSIADLPRELAKLGEILNSSGLKSMAEEARGLIEIDQGMLRQRQTHYLRNRTLNDFASVLEVWKKPQGPRVDASMFDLIQNDYQFLYLIWSKPFMTVAPDRTFIGSMMRQFGVPLLDFSSSSQPSNMTKYPEVDLDKVLKQQKLILFCSSEPFPFAKSKAQILGKLEDAARTGTASNHVHGAVLVDGEPWSWFGVRSLRFLSETLFE